MKPTTYTPEPWRYEASTKTIRAVPANYWLASMDSWDGTVNHEANATRIVVCVNACKGIQDPEKAIPAAREALEDMLYLAENLNALEGFSNSCPTQRYGELCGHNACNECGCIVRKVKLARAALTLLKGETE